MIDPYNEARSAAAETLAGLANQSKFQLTTRLYSLRSVGELRGTLSTAVASLIGQLKDKEVPVRTIAIKTLEKLAIHGKPRPIAFL
jgi:hypothetical protein